MPQMPRQQADVLALADQMAAGIAKYPDIFVHGDADAIKTARDQYTQASGKLNKAKSMMKQAAKEKQRKFEALKSTVKQQLKLSQADVADQPLKLNFIGWGPRRKASNVPPPPPPINLKILDRYEDQITLIWKKPRKIIGTGPVVGYKIETRYLADATNKSWQLIGMTFDCSITLHNQSLVRTREYRIISVNHNGQSLPSNTAEIL